MLKIQKYFESLGFSGDDLQKILSAFELQHFKKNDFIVEEGKTSIEPVSHSTFIL
jgi:hypothetical protein